MFDFNDPLVRVFVTGFLISLPFKIAGIWRAAQNKQRGWFALLLIFNTLGILDLTYLFYFSKPREKHPD